MNQDASDHLQFTFRTLELVAMQRQICDITLYSGKPRLDVHVDPKFLYALMYGAGAKAMLPLLSAIELSDGSTVRLDDIWTIHPMPQNGFTDAELLAVDLSEAEKPAGLNGETMRTMISKTYHCETRDEEDKFIRRFLAS
jgi:hypothetical protein